MDAQAPGVDARAAVEGRRGRWCGWGTSQAGRAAGGRRGPGVAGAPRPQGGPQAGVCGADCVLHTVRKFRPQEGGRWTQGHMHGAYKQKSKCGSGTPRQTDGGPAPTVWAPIVYRLSFVFIFIFIFIIIWFIFIIFLFKLVSFSPQ